MPTLPTNQLQMLSDPGTHVAIVGKTGTGKSTLLRAVCERDLRTGRGLLLVDPHGDLATDVLAHVPRRRRNDLVVFDPTDPGACPGLNPLRKLDGASRALVVSTVIATMRKIWPESWGPRTEHVLRNILLGLADVRGATLVDARAVLVDENRRAWMVKQVKDEIVRDFWLREFPGYGRQLQAEATAPVLNKLGAFLSNPLVRAVVTKGRPVLDAETCLGRSRIVVARLPKGVLGEDAALLLGGLMLGAFQHATMARARVPAPDRHPFTLVVDEVASFATRPFVELLAEARKYGVHVVLATQSLAAMDPGLRAGLLGNAGTLVSFRVGGEDAELLQREFIERFGPPTLMKLDVGEYVIRRGADDAQIIRRPARDAA